MKRLISGFLVLIFFMAILPARSQWIPCQGIEGAHTRDIILLDSNLYIANDGAGIYMKNISATAWDSACLYGAFLRVRSTGSALFCWGYYDSFRSLDDGLTWESIDEFNSIYGIETLDNYVFIADEDALLRSADNGETWVTLHPIPGSNEIENLFAQDGILFIQYYDVDSIFESDNYGESWIKFPHTGIEGYGYIVDIYSFNNRLFVGGRGGVFLYNENSSVWEPMNDSIPSDTWIENFFEDSGTLYCCTIDGYFSFDAQDSIWKDKSDGLESRVCWSACKVGNSVYLATDSGPFYRQGESSWTACYNDLFQRYIDQVFTIGSRIYATSGEKLFYSDSLEGVFNVLSSQGYCQANKLIITDSAWYAGSVCGFLITYDSGLTWSLQNMGMEGARVSTIAITDSFYFANASLGGLFRTRKDFIAWERVPNDLDWANIWGVSSVNNVVFASRYDGDTGLYRSTDYGTTFMGIPEGGSSAPEIFIKNERIFVMKTNGDVIYSTDFGITWQNWISGLEDIMLTSMDVSSSFDTTLLGGRVFLDGYLFKMYTPGNQEGLDIIGNLPPSSYPYMQTVFFNDGRIIASPNFGGLWYRDDLMVGIKDDDLSEKEPSEKLLLFPNPVNDMLTIDLQETGDHNECLIFDQLGRMIKRDVCEKGNSPATIDVSGFPQGVYFVVIHDSQGVSRAGKFVKTD
jgi:photosystem II stability/assembly factor-like uncharacterized protein